MMGSNTKIEWANHTMNFWRGCRKVSDGCDNCYMFREQKRWGHDPGKVVRTSKAIWRQPLAKGLKAWKPGDRIFVNSWSDFWHPDADAWRDEAWEVIGRRPDLIWMFLTKRPERIQCEFFVHNQWVGVTGENQYHLEKRWEALFPGIYDVMFVSIEPMLGEIRIDRLEKYGRLPDWVICGCESGPGRRETKIEWIKSLRDQCIETNTPFFLKQRCIGGSLVKMPSLDGKVWDQLPRINDE